jgi:hypothetical protein
VPIGQRSQKISPSEVLSRKIHPYCQSDSLRKALLNGRLVLSTKIKETTTGDYRGERKRNKKLHLIKEITI